MSYKAIEIESYGFNWVRRRILAIEIRNILYIEIWCLVMYQALGRNLCELDWIERRIRLFLSEQDLSDNFNVLLG